MKIGILTFHRPCNFGANLQAYTSSSYFQSLGHETYILNYVRETDYAYAKHINHLQYKEHKCFVETKLPITREVNTANELRQLVIEKGIQLIVIGADAVWRNSQDNNIYFAQWVFEAPETSHIPVVSMSAAHMGNGFKNLSPNKQNAIKQCLDRFRCITVRDTWTRDVINRDIYNGENKITLINPDPVVLLDIF